MTGSSASGPKPALASRPSRRSATDTMYAMTAAIPTTGTRPAGTRAPHASRTPSTACTTSAGATSRQRIVWLSGSIATTRPQHSEYTTSAARREPAFWSIECPAQSPAARRDAPTGDRRETHIEGSRMCTESVCLPDSCRGASRIAHPEFPAHRQRGPCLY